MSSDDRLLITGANGFIGSRVVETLLKYGFMKLRCFVRSSGNLDHLDSIIKSYDSADVDYVRGNLLSREDCNKAVDGISVIFHMAAGISKSFSGSFMNSVVTTRNLLDSTVASKSIKRFLNVSSFAVYSNVNIERGGLLDEACEIESPPQKRAEAYCYGKIKQDEIVSEYSKEHNLPCVTVRPGVVFGPGKNAITGRVGIGTFGIYLHLGGSNRIPFTYVDNCAEAIVLAGITKGIEGEIFNIVDDDLPRSNEFLKSYKSRVGKFKSISIPYNISYFLCYLWEKYSKWSKGQLPPVFNRSRCSAEWKGNTYSNNKLKDLLGWTPRVSIEEAMSRYYEFSKSAGGISGTK